MFRFIIALGAIVIAAPASAQVSCQRIGNQTFCSNGFNAQTYGNQTYYNQNGRSLGYSQDFGNMQFYTPAPTPNMNIYTPPRTYNPYGYGNYGR